MPVGYCEKPTSCAPVKEGNMIEKDDWRLDPYPKELEGKIFRLKKFVPHGNWDHEHCEFCWKKFYTKIISDHCALQGYVTYCAEWEREVWVCEECFADFRELFGWKVEE